MGKKTNQLIGRTRSQTFNIKKNLTKPQQFIVLKTKIWKKDSHGLFDYDTQQTQYQTHSKTIHPFRKKIQKQIHKNKNKIKKENQKESKIYICRNKECQTFVFYSDHDDIDEKLNQYLGICEILATKTKRGINFKIRSLLRLENLNKITSQIQKQNQKFIQSQLSKNKPMMMIQKGKQSEIKVFNPVICPFTVTRNFYAEKSNIQGYPLKTGNIVKFGRIQYIVIQTSTQKQFSSLRTSTDLRDVSGYEKTYQINPNQEGQPNVKLNDEQWIPTCKVCLCSGQTEEDGVLISPCNCKGYCGAIHVGCLKKWINSKVKKQHLGMVQSYNFNRFQCQICKVPFPQVIKLNEKKIQMMGIQKPKKPYIIIQSINPPRLFLNGPHSRQSRQEQRCIHVISCQKESLKIGRGHNCQIRMTDISVSRSHAQIQFNDNKFLIKDSKSKFGTLILFDEQFNLNKNHPLTIQCGRCIYQFALDQKICQQQNQGETESQKEQSEMQPQNNQNQINDK